MKPKNERFWWLLACIEAVFMILKSSQDRDTLIEQSVTPLIMNNDNKPPARIE